MAEDKNLTTLDEIRGMLAESYKPFMAEKLDGNNELLSSDDILNLTRLIPEVKEALLKSEFSQEFSSAVKFKNRRDYLARENHTADFSDDARRVATDEIKNHYGFE